MTTTTDPDLTAADVAWDLEPLLDGRGETAVEEMLDDADRRATALEAQRGKVGELDPAALAAVMREVEQINELVGRVGSYAGLRFAVDSTDAERGKLLARVEERSTDIGNKLLFLELEWAALPDEHVAPRARVARPRVLPSLPRDRAALPAAPPVRARGADRRREGGHRSQRVGVASSAS